MVKLLKNIDIWEFLSSAWNKYQKLFLFLIPLFYFTAGAYFRSLLGDLSLIAIDPEYAYFFSGLTLSEGHGNLGHIDHPGTPLQIVIAAIFRLLWIFRSSHGNYFEDLFLHPDLYLSVVNLTVTFLISSALYLAGKAFFSFTKSIWYGLLFQTAPFLPVLCYDIAGRILPELLLLIPVLLLSFFLIKYYFRSFDPSSYRNIMILAMISALGLSVKLSYLPLCIIPFLITPSLKRKSIFVAFTLCFFFLMAFPVTHHVSSFWKWITGLIIHSGRYGGGNANFIDLKEFFVNFNFFLHWEKPYLSILATTVSAFLVYLIILRRKSDKSFVLLTSGVLLASLLQIFIVCKHFAHHYLIPGMLLTPLLIFLLSRMILQAGGTRKYILITTNLLLILFLIWKFDSQFYYIRMKSDRIGETVHSLTDTKNFTSTLDKNSVKIIASLGYGCPFPEYALMNGYCWAGKHKPTYSPELSKLYPDSYFYFTSDNSLLYWGEKFDPQKILSQGNSVFLYLERNEDEMYNKTMDKLQSESGNQLAVERELLYCNAETKEAIYKLTLTLQNSL